VDNVTHTLFAATLSATPLRAAGRGSAVALIIASNAPDIDIVTAVTSGAEKYLAAHRGATHGPIGILGLAVATAALVRLTHRRARFGPLLALSLLGVLLHIGLDLPTSYGTRLFSPISHTWYSLDWVPIIDVYLWIILAVGTFAAWRREPRTRAALATLGAMLALYGVRAVAHDLALRQATDRSACVVRGLAAWEPGGRGPELPCSATISALPRFLSPFEWRVIEHRGPQYTVMDVNVMRGTTTMPVRVASEQGPLVAQAAATNVVRGFLDFSRYPVARSRKQDGGTVVRWHDLRFVSPAGPLNPDAEPRRGMFTVSVLVDESGRIIEERFGDH
jgi:inner membrane protein